MNFKKNGKVFTSKSVGTGPSSYEKRIYRAAVSQRLRNTVLQHACLTFERRYAKEERVCESEGFHGVWMRTALFRDTKFQIQVSGPLNF